MDKISFNVKSKPTSKLVPSNSTEINTEPNNIEYLNVYTSGSSRPKLEKPLIIHTDLSHSFENKIHKTVESREDPSDSLEQAAIDELTHGMGQPQSSASAKRKIVIEQSDDSDPEEADYAKVSVEDFGLAMIRGMGWKEGKGVGKTFKAVCPVKDVVLRTPLRGLGVDAALDRGEIIPGGNCAVAKGSYKGYYGTVESIVNGVVRLKILLLGKVVNLSPNVLKVITCDEYNQKNGEVKKEPKKELVTPVTEEPVPYVDTWLKVNLIVRIINKSSPHFRARAIIKEITKPLVCNCALEIGSFTVTGVNEDELETVIPQNSDDLVYIVKGTHCGKVGRVVKKERSKRIAMVELTDKSTFSFHYSEICCIAPNPR